MVKRAKLLYTVQFYEYLKAYRKENDMVKQPERKRNDQLTEACKMLF